VHNSPPALSPLSEKADDSVDIYFQADSPDKESNWPPCPAGGFTLLLPLYGPQAKYAQRMHDPSRSQKNPIQEREKKTPIPLTFACIAYQKAQAV
jgi:Protein of unknown function (DUF1214)